MNKNTLISFVEKYNLNAAVEAVKFIVKDNVLKTTFVTEDKTLAGTITANKFTFEDSEFGIFDTTKFKNFLKALEEDITITLNKTDGVATSLTIADKNIEESFMLSDLSVIPNAPKIKEVKAYDLEIPITADFVSRFVKAKNVLSDVESFTLMMNKKGDKLELVIGWSSINSNRIKMEVGALAGKDKIEKPISFNANYFRDILTNNSDCTGAIFKVASVGISQIEFSNTDFVSTYYLIQKKLEG